MLLDEVGEAMLVDAAESGTGLPTLMCAVPVDQGDRAAQAMRQARAEAGWSGGSV